jgi:hypothetical protein
VADVSTVQANMQRLLKVLQEGGWPVKTVMVVGDRAMLSAEIVLSYYKANLKCAYRPPQGSRNWL